MKKLLSVLAVLFVLGTVNVFALGIGPQGGTTPGKAGGHGGLSLKIDGVPCVFAVTGHFLKNSTSIGLTADWWVANPKIQGTWGYFYGLGLAGSVSVGDDSGHVFLGGRALVGTNVFFLNNFLELYAQVAWEPGIWITDGLAPTFTSFPVNLGLRFWI